MGSGTTPQGISPTLALQPMEIHHEEANTDVPTLTAIDGRTKSMNSPTMGHNGTIRMTTAMEILLLVFKGMPAQSILAKVQKTDMGVWTQTWMAGRILGMHSRLNRPNGAIAIWMDSVTINQPLPICQTLSQAILHNGTIAMATRTETTRTERKVIGFQTTLIAGKTVIGTV